MADEMDDFNGVPCIANGGLPFRIRVPSEEVTTTVMAHLGAVRIEWNEDGTADLYHKPRRRR